MLQEGRYFIVKMYRGDYLEISVVLLVRISQHMFCCGVDPIEPCVWIWWFPALVAGTTPTSGRPSQPATRRWTLLWRSCPGWVDAASARSAAARRPESNQHALCFRTTPENSTTWWPCTSSTSTSTSTTTRCVYRDGVHGGPTALVCVYTEPGGHHSRKMLFILCLFTG